MYVVIMAGGVGTRFWPKSRFRRPKQLLKIIDSDTMIQATIKRLKGVITDDQIYIVTTKQQQEEIQKQVPFLESDNIIIEPKGKNTAPCIGLAALMLKQRDPDAVMAILPADHKIENVKKYQKILIAAEKLALQKDCLVTIGIKPTYPSTGYGYIQLNHERNFIDEVPAFKVKTFAEKPDLKTAERFLQSGDFLWNSGMFIWKAAIILKEIEESLPELYDGLLEIEKYLGTDSEQEVIQKVYCRIKSISIDYGVMEQSENVCVLKGDFNWNDVGSWEEVYKISPKDESNNVIFGNHIIEDTNGCFIDSENKFVATIGLKNLIVVNTDDALLICSRDRAQEVKELVELIKRKKLDQYL